MSDSQQTTLTGRRLGAYQVHERIGAGGMGDVYRARDTRLGRDIALKALPAAFTDDPERLARFEREARVLAAMNHPNIATIYGIEESPAPGEGPVRALVMELVEGTTLAERLAHGPVSVREALAIAKQIADALEAAHEKGVVHRDLKPANVMLTPAGVAKVLDFGIAKVAVAASAGGAAARSIAGDLTSEGMIIGTAAYMSPEQAQGQAVDRRTDIWAHGCVLYELLTGEQAFRGQTVPDTLVAILAGEPNWDAVPAATPPGVRRLLRRCLEKDPRRRLRDIGDAQLELEEALSEAASEDRPAPHARVTRRTAVGALLGAAAGAIGGAVAVGRFRTDATPRSLARFAIALPDTASFSASFNKRIAISPDGAHLAFNVTLRGTANTLLVRPLGELELKPAAEGARGVPFFSPDGQWLAYFATDAPWRMRKVALSGGAPVNICALENFAGATWGADDMIYFVAAVPGGLVRVPAGGGEPMSVLDVRFDSGERLFKFPHALPGAHAILLTVGTVDTESFDEASIAVFSPRTGAKRILVEGGTAPAYSPSGHLVYARNGDLLAVRFDPARLEVSGRPFTVLEGVLMSRTTGPANFDISASGDLAYVPGRAVGGARTVHWVNRSGHAEQLPLPPRSYLHPRLAPDDTRLAVEIEGSDHDLYLYDFRSGVLSKLTTDGTSHWPVWSPDGRRIGYRSGPMGKFRLFQIPADRSGPAEALPSAGVSQSPGSYSPDGRAIAYTTNLMTGGVPKVAVALLDGDRAPQQLDETRYAQGSPRFSPDGRYLAYCANESGRSEVYAQAFPGPGPKVQVSSDGGTDPVWRRDGRELFYRSGERMMAIPVSTAPVFSAGRPQELWRGPYSHGASSSCGAPGLTASNYDVTADGRRFLMIRDDDVEAETSREIVVVQRWAAELTRLARAAD
jgi:serine/threonine-protein kinase